MRYSFMSFSLPDAGLSDLVDAARRFGYDGLEPRIDAGHRHGIEVETGRERRREAREIVAGAGLEIACVATGCRFADPDRAGAEVERGRRAVELAADVGAARVRVFGGQPPEGVGRDAAHASVVRSLRELAPAAAAHGVTLTLETHDAWTDPVQVAAVMEDVGHPAVGVNWDVQHTPRTGGATLASAHDRLRPWIAHVHFHDADRRGFVPIGDGDIDHRRVLSILTEAGYDGYLSGEWFGWEPGEVHLPREIAAIRRLEGELV